MEVNNMVEATEVKKLTTLERLKYFFINPNKLFAEYNDKPTWLVKFLIVTVVTIVSTMLTKALTVSPQIDMIMQQSPDMPREQAEAVVQFMNSPLMTGLAVGAAIIGVVAAVFLGSLVYYGLISLFGGKTKYMKIVSVYTLAYIPASIGGLITIGFAYFTNNYEGLMQPKLMDVLFRRFDLFVIWQALLLIFGFAKISDLKLQKSTAIVIIMWLIATGISFVPVLMAGLR